MTFFVNIHVCIVIKSKKKLFLKICFNYFWVLFEFRLIIMTDVEIEIPKDTDTSTETPTHLINENTTEIESESNDTGKPVASSEAKKKYDGRKKKRQWVFNRRDDDAKRVRTAPEDRVKRRKYLMVLGYAGANYIGMQRNPNVNTIEEELLKAFLKNKMITEDSFNQPQYAHFQRAARTDKGVSAARQCISLKLRRFLFLCLANLLPME